MMFFLRFLYLFSLGLSFPPFHLYLLIEGLESLYMFMNFVSFSRKCVVFLGKALAGLCPQSFTEDKLLLICHCYDGSSAWVKVGNNLKIQMSTTEGYETIEVIFRNNENNSWWLVILSRGKWTCWKNILLMTFSWISAFFIYCLTKDNSTIDLNIGIEDRVSNLWPNKLSETCMHSTWKDVSFACSTNGIDHWILYYIEHCQQPFYFLSFWTPIR